MVIGRHTNAGFSLFVRQEVHLGGDGIGAWHAQFGADEMLSVNAATLGALATGSNVIVGANAVVIKN
ncbi:hypothetical protein OAO71_00385 [Planctomycetota bacterium]|nr:hypothetical protein [Planctomycetota bacterium]